MCEYERIWSLKNPTSKGSFLEQNLSPAIKLHRIASETFPDRNKAKGGTYLWNSFAYVFSLRTT